VSGFGYFPSDRERLDGERMNTAGFYKNGDGVLLHSATTVESGLYFLLAADHDQYQYPVDGWYWFDDEESARLFLDVPLPEEPEPPFPDDLVPPL
jgi:hypothetical protein